MYLLVKREVTLKTKLRGEEVQFILSKIINSKLYEKRIGAFYGELEDDKFKLYKQIPLNQTNVFMPAVTGKLYQEDGINYIHLIFSFRRKIIIFIAFAVIFSIGYSVSSLKDNNLWDGITTVGTIDLVILLLAFYVFRSESKKIEDDFLELFDAEIA